MKRFTLLLTAILLASLAFGGAGCDGRGSPNAENPGDSDFDSLSQAWKYSYRIAGNVYLRPEVVEEDSLVLFSGDAHLTAVSVSRDSVIWKSDNLDPSDPLQSIDLVVHDEAVYGYHTGKIIAWELENGSRRWTFTSSPSDNRILNFGFPDVGPDYFYGSGGGKHILVDREKGDMVSSREAGAVGVTLRDSALYLGQGWTPEGAEGQSRGAVLKVRATTGDTLWSFKTNRGGFYRIRPIVRHDRLYAGTQGGEMTEFVALDAETGEVIWRNKEARVYAAEMAAGKIFVNTGRDVMALDKETGETLWHAGLEAGHGESGLAYLDGYVYHPHGQGLRVINAKTGEVVHIEWPENGYFWEVSTGAGKVFAQDSGALYAFEPYSPK